MEPSAGVIRPQSARVKGLSHEIFKIGMVDSVHKLEDNRIHSESVWNVFHPRGLRPWYDNERITQELGRPWQFRLSMKGGTCRLRQ
jgi:hypothetical protein